MRRTGDPGMTTCESMRFGCFQFSYPELKGVRWLETVVMDVCSDHFAMAGLNIHNNKWSYVHDFTSSDGKKRSTWECLVRIESQLRMDLVLV